MAPERLRRYFESAETTEPGEWRIGLEVETLFVDEAGEPLSVDQGEAVFEGMAGRGWRPAGDASTDAWELQRGDFRSKPEVGAGNIELITPPRSVRAVERLLAETLDELDELYRIAEDRRARPVFDVYDGFEHVDNLVLPDERDRKWARVDGRAALKHLGHIASVHLTVDVASIAEAFEWTAAVNDLAERRGWPRAESVDVWSNYLETSRVDYHPDRAGPTPETFDAYLAALRTFRVVMDRDEKGGLRRLTPDPPRLGEIEERVDLPMFLGTVWFHTRLRVVDDRLALEIRMLPRGSDEEWTDNVREILDHLSVSSPDC